MFTLKQTPEVHSNVFYTQATTLTMLYSSLSAVEFIDLMGKRTNASPACLLCLIQKNAEMAKGDGRKPLPFAAACLVYYQWLHNTFSQKLVT